MDNLTTRDLALLQTYVKPKTVQQAADELTISYDVCVRQTRKLLSAGLLGELPYRENKKRMIFTRRRPGVSESISETHQIFWNNRFASFSELSNELLAKAFGSFAYELWSSICYLWYNSWLKAQSDAPLQINAAMVRTRLQRAIVITRMQLEFAEEVLKAPFWSDSEFVHTLINNNPKNPEAMMKIARDYLQRVYGEGKDVME